MNVTVDLQSEESVPVLWGEAQVQSLADLDTAMMDGKSIQRTMECIFVNNDHADMKQLHRLSDGESYSTVVSAVSIPAVGQPGGQGNPLVD